MNKEHVFIIDKVGTSDIYLSMVFKNRSTVLFNKCRNNDDNILFINNCIIGIIHTAMFIEEFDVSPIVSKVI